MSPPNQSLLYRMIKNNIRRDVYDLSKICAVIRLRNSKSLGCPTFVTAKLEVPSLIDSKPLLVGEMDYKLAQRRLEDAEV